MNTNNTSTSKTISSNNTNITMNVLFMDRFYITANNTIAGLRPLGYNNDEIYSYPPAFLHRRFICMNVTSRY